MSNLTIRSFMTPAPHTIGVDQTLAAAEELMRAHQIRHLPVLDGGQLVGMLSARDVAVIRSLPGVNAARVAVAEAMTPHPHALSPDSALEWVAADMAAHKLGSTVVVDKGRVVGIFTTVDALRALQELLGRSRRRQARGA
jgi:acetoin utilization protein AcuB